MMQDQQQCTYRLKKRQKQVQKTTTKVWKGSRDGVPKNIQTRVIKKPPNFKGQPLLWQLSLVTT